MCVDLIQFQFCTTTNEFGRRNINKHARTLAQTHTPIYAKYCAWVIHTFWISTVFDTFRDAAHPCNSLHVHDKTEYNSRVIFHGRGIPF